MVDVARPAGLIEQLWLVVLVRWQIFRNGLRSSSEVGHLVGSVALGLLYSVLGLVVSVLICFGSFAMTRTQNWFGLSLLLWGVFLFWQLAPILVSGMNPGFDGRNLLRFPLRFSAFFLLSVAYGIAEPFAIAGILWHTAIGLGVTIARPDLFFWAALGLILSLIVNLLFSRLVYSWLERLLAKRLTREIVTAFFVLIFVGLQFSGFILQRRGPALRRGLRNTAGIWSALPPALGSDVMERAAADEPLAALRTAGLLGIYSAVFGAFFALRVRAQYTGEDLSESAAPVRPKALEKIAPPSALLQRAASVQASPAASKILDGPVAAIFIKEVRYFYRNSMLMMNMFTPLILILIFILPRSMTRDPSGSPIFGHFGSDFAYPIAAAYIVLFMMAYYPNNLAYEGFGIERLFLAPVQFRDVMLAKNLFHGALLGLEAILLLILVSVTWHPPSTTILLATWSALLFAALIDLAAGNWLSLQFPRRYQFGMRGQRPSGLTTIISFGLFFAKMLVIAGFGYLAIWLAGLWLLPLVYLALSVGALAIYRFILEGTSRQAILHRDVILEQLSR